MVVELRLPDFNLTIEVVAMVQSKIHGLIPHSTRTAGDNISAGTITNLCKVHAQSNPHGPHGAIDDGTIPSSQMSVY